MSKLIHEMIFLIVVICSLFAVKYAENHNGRLEMCEELGMYYLKNEGCVTETMFNLVYNKSNYVPKIVIDKSVFKGE